MSKASNQALTLLAVVGGCLKEIDRTNMFSVVKMKEHVRQSYEDTIKVIELWPSTGDEIKNGKWIIDKVSRWEKYLNEEGDFYKLPVMAAVCERCLDDLHTRTKDKSKKKMLVPLFEPITKVRAFVDPDGRNFPAYEKANILMDNLYDLIEWRWE